MKTKFRFIFIFFQSIVIIALIINNFRLDKELFYALYREQLLKEDSKILIQLINLKEYKYEDFFKINDEDYIMYCKILPEPQVGPITINNFKFYFSNDSSLLYIPR